MATLDMPAIYLLPTHIEPDMLPGLESQIPTLTFDITEADIVLGRISKKERANFELRRRGVLTTEVSLDVEHELVLPAKRRRISAAQDLSTSSESEGDKVPRKHGQTETYKEEGPAEVVRVVHINWFTDSVAKGRVLPVQEYLIYQGRRDTHDPGKKQMPKSAGILRCARDGVENVPQTHRATHGYMDSDKHSRSTVPLKRPALLKETTSEHDHDLELPPVPEYLRTTYSCQRPTPFSSPNHIFIEELNKIRMTRTLTGDKVGVRAYSSCIASLAAYPYLIGSPQEVARLPGCGPKIAVLFQEWKETGKIQEIETAAADPHILVLQLFYNIWGVGETTAREFYNKGWRDLDDIVEFGWNSLLRVQQIGVKYYDEFLQKIPRMEVESIGNTILAHACRRRKGYQMVIVGGYRRGKEGSGDVDIVLSHPDLEATYNFVEELVVALERSKFITHTLTLSNKNSERGQIPVAWKGEDKNAGSGFDTLDKALVVWQDPNWDEAKTAKNPNPHRRVDIIIAPWKTAGCAVLGWSGGTTFQRDIRRYCKVIKHFKFDSSGIRSRIDGHWVDLESADGVAAPDMLTAERRVFEGLGLEYRPPEHRCTG